MPVILGGCNSTLVIAPVEDTLVTAAAAPKPKFILPVVVKINSSPISYPSPPLLIEILPNERVYKIFCSSEAPLTKGAESASTVGTDAKIDTSCFRYCVSCKASIATNDAAFDAALNVFPNPAQNEVTLNYNFSEATNINVSVLNTLGQVMYSEKISGADAGAAVLDVKNITDGVYMIQVTDDKNRQSVKRLVIQK